MENYGKTARVSARDAAIDIVRSLRAHSHIAYFAGGCVRDELLGVPASDYDVATDATPHTVARLFPRAMHVGAAFGVMLVREQGFTIEVATFRSDGPYSDRRRPDQVTFSDPVADAQRRDFTVNALFLDPLSPPDPAQASLLPMPASGLVIDHVHGIDDLRNRVLRAVGDPDQRLKEDHLRALRAARLAAKLGLTIDPATAGAIRGHAAELHGVSRERIGEELRKLMKHASRGTAVGLLHDLGLDVPIAGDSPRWEPRRLSAMPAGADFSACLAAWALDRDPAQAPASAIGLIESWRGSMCLSNHEYHRATAILALVQRLAVDWPSSPVAGRKRLASETCFPEARMLLEVDAPELSRSIDHDARLLAATPGGLSPEPWLTGNDLVNAGLRPGPAFRRILDQVYDAQLEGRVASRAEALSLALKLANAG